MSKLLGMNVKRFLMLSIWIGLEHFNDNCLHLFAGCSENWLLVGTAGVSGVLSSDMWLTRMSSGAGVGRAS
jgi:hypothetical protein